MLLAPTRSMLRHFAGRGPLQNPAHWKRHLGDSTPQFKVHAHPSAGCAMHLHA